MIAVHLLAFDPAAVLDRLEDPVLLLDQQRQILYSNAATRRVLAAKLGFEVRHDRFVVTTPSADAQLAQAIAEYLRPINLKRLSPRGLRVPRKSGTGDWLVLISPMRVANSGCSCAFLIHLVSRVHTRQLPMGALRDLFGLTNKELDVLSGLLRRESLRMIAQRMSLSHETVRTYVKRILRKCNVDSQAELIGLAQRLSLLAGAIHKRTHLGISKPPSLQAF